jgi:hypothetical protein
MSFGFKQRTAPFDQPGVQQNHPRSQHMVIFGGTQRWQVMSHPLLCSPRKRARLSCQRSASLASCCLTHPPLDVPTSMYAQMLMRDCVAIAIAIAVMHVRMSDVPHGISCVALPRVAAVVASGSPVSEDFGSPLLQADGPVAISCLRICQSL